MSKKTMKKLLCCCFVAVLCIGMCVCARAAGLTASCDPASAAPGDMVTFTLTLNNDSPYFMQNLSYNSDYSGFSFNGPNLVNPGENGVYSGAIAMLDAMLDVPITFTLHWEYYDASGVSVGQDSAVATLTVPRSAAALGGAAGAVSADRTASMTQASSGDVVTLTYTFTNNSGLEITGLSIKDPELFKDPLVKDATVAPGEIYSAPFDYTMGRNTVKSAPVFTYKLDGVEQTASVSEISIGMVNVRLNVEVVQSAPTEEGVNFTINLTNNGNQKISKIRIKDEKEQNVNSDTFALSVGESRTFNYMAPNAEERNVVFYLSGSAATGEEYADKTKTYVVRRYIDPALVGLEFSAALTETLDQNGSVKVRFTVNNTGSLELKDLVLSEAELGELRRQEKLPLGETTLEETVNVGGPRDLVFTLNVQDEAGNDYTYTANITAAYVGVESQATAPAAQTNAIDDIETIGAEIGKSVNNALTVAMVVLGVLCALSAAALIILRILEQKEKEQAARRRAYRERQARSARTRTEATSDGSTRTARPTGNYGRYGGYDGETITRPRPPRE